MPYLSGNNVDLLIDGETTFTSILDAIDQAQGYILFQFFIIHDDELGCHGLPAAYADDLRTAGDFIDNFGPRYFLEISDHLPYNAYPSCGSWLVSGHK